MRKRMILLVAEPYRLRALRIKISQAVRHLVFVATLVAAATVTSAEYVKLSVYDGKTPLMWASQSGDSPAVETFVTAGRDVNARDSEGMTPLMYAALWNQNAEVITVLVHAGALFEERDSDGNTPLAHATLNSPDGKTVGDVGMMTALIALGADAQARNNLGMTPLHTASEHGSVAWIRPLVEARADPATASWSGVPAWGREFGFSLPAGQTPLMLSAQSGSEEVVRVLLGLGVNPLVP